MRAAAVITLAAMFAFLAAVEEASAVQRLVVLEEATSTT